MNRQFYIFFIIILTTGCANNVNPENLIDRFNSTKASLDSLVATFRNDNRFDSLFHVRIDDGIPNIKALYPKEMAIIDKNGIVNISSNKNVSGRRSNWYYIKTNWAAHDSIYLLYNFVGQGDDSLENEKGFYKIDEYKNETWGLGDKWKMFRFVDTIRNIKF